MAMTFVRVSRLFIIIISWVIIIVVLLLDVNYCCTLLLYVELLYLELYEVTNLVMVCDHLLAKFVGDQSCDSKVQSTKYTEFLYILNQTGQLHSCFDFLDVTVDTGIVIVTAGHLVDLVSINASETNFL